MNSEGRYVAAALIPPRRLDAYDQVDRAAQKLLVSDASKTDPTLLPNDEAPKVELPPPSAPQKLSIPRSPLLPDPNESKQN